MYLSSFLPSFQHEQQIVSSKLIQGSLMMPSFVEPNDSCWLDVHSTTMIFYLMMDFHQLLKSCETNHVSSLSVQFHLAVKDGDKKVLLENALLFLDSSSCIQFTKEELALEDKLPLDKRRLFIIRFNTDHKLLNKFVNDPQCLFRLAAEIHWSSKVKNKTIFVSKVFRLSSSRLIIDLLSSDNLTTTRPTLTAKLYDYKPWWYFSSSVPMISQSKSLQNQLLAWTKKLENNYGLDLEDVRPFPSSSSSSSSSYFLFRIRVASVLFDKLFQEEEAAASASANAFNGGGGDGGDLSFVCSQTVMNEAPILCPAGKERTANGKNDYLRIHLLTSDSMEPCFIPCELVVNHEIVLDLDETTKSFHVPANLWHKLVPTSFFQTFPSLIDEEADQDKKDTMNLLSTEDNEISLILYLRLKKSMTNLANNLFIPYFQLCWTNDATGKVLYSDSAPNRSLKTTFVVDDPTTARVSTKATAEESLQLVKDIREVSALRKKIQDLESQLTTQKHLQPLQPPQQQIESLVNKSLKRKPVLQTTQNESTNDISLEELLGLKEEMNNWIQNDSKILNQKQCVYLFTALCSAIIDDLQQQQWLHVSFSSSFSSFFSFPTKSSTTSVTNVHKKQRCSSSMPPLKATKEVFVAWIQACLQFMKSNYPRDDVEGMKTFLRESFSNNPSNLAYNAALEKCLQVRFSRFGDLCSKLKCTIEELVV